MGEPRRESYRIPGIRPWTGERVNFWLPLQLVRQIQKHDADWKFRSIPLIPTVTEHPESVFSGLSRDNRREDESGWCYCGRPERTLTPGGVDVPRPPGMIFAAFISDADEIFNWGWEPQDPNDESAPRGFEQRFEQRLWPPNDR